MKEYKMLYAAGVLAAGYLVLHNPAKEWIAAFFVILLLPLLCWLILKAGIGNPEFHMLFENELEMSVRLRCNACASRIRVSYLVKNHFTGREHRICTDLYVKDSQFQGKYELSDHSCGYIEIIAEHMDCFDWLGVSKVRCSLSHNAGQYIYPEKRTEGRENRKSVTKACTGLEEIRGPREYMQGEPIQRIHWKLSAKMRKLLVRLYDDYKMESLCLLMNFEHADAKAAEFILGKTMYFSEQLSLEGRSHLVAMVSAGKLYTYEVDNLEAHYLMMNQVLKNPFDAEKDALSYQEFLEHKGMKVEMITRVPRSLGP